MTTSPVSKNLLLMQSRECNLPLTQLFASSHIPAQRYNSPMIKEHNWETQRSEEVDTSIELLTIKEVAQLLKVSPVSVRRLQYGRHVPFIKVGGSVRFNRRDIVEYLKKETNIPDDLIKAARIDGAGFWRIFAKIILPLSPPILIVTVIWQFTGIWNEFLFGLVFTGGTQQPITASLVALATSQMNAHPYDVASAAVLIGAVPPLLIYLFGGKYFVRGLTQGAIK